MVSLPEKNEEKANLISSQHDGDQPNEGTEVHSRESPLSSVTLFCDARN